MLYMKSSDLRSFEVNGVNVLHLDPFRLDELRHCCRVLEITPIDSNDGNHSANLVQEAIIRILQVGQVLDCDRSLHRTIAKLDSLQ